MARTGLVAAFCGVSAPAIVPFYVLAADTRYSHAKKTLGIDCDMLCALNERMSTQPT